VFPLSMKAGLAVIAALNEMEGTPGVKSLGDLSLASPFP